MNRIELSKGALVSHNGENYEIKAQIDEKYVLAKHLGTYREEILPISELGSRKKNTEGSDRNYMHISDEDWEVAKERLKIIEPILKYNLPKSEVIEIGKKHNLHYTTLYRWKRRYEQNPVLSSLVPNTKARGPKGHVRISEEADLITKHAIEELYLHKQKLPVTAVYREIQKRCKNANVTPPHINTVRLRIKQLSEAHVVARREGRNAADRKYRNTDGVFPEGTCPLDVVQIDHTPMDIIVVDEIERKPIGRPYLTMAMDVYSRMVTGIYLSLDAPGYFSVNQCLAMSIMTKERYLKSVGVEGEWNIWGFPKKLHLDNAAEFRSKDLKRFCEQYGITLMFRPVARPQFGGHIERLIGTTMREIHTLPGSTFSNIAHKGEYDSEKKAALTLFELETIVVDFIVNVYHKRIHASIGMSPEKKFEIGVFGDGDTLGTGLPAKVADETRLKLDLLPGVERTVQQHGVVIDTIKYYHDVLRRRIKEKEKGTGKTRKFLFKYDPRDISKIWFYDPDIEDYFEIPYRNLSFPPISKWELHHILRALKEKNVNDINEFTIFEAYERMNRVKQEAVKKTKAQRRKESANVMRQKKKALDGIGPKQPDGHHDQDNEENRIDNFDDAKPFDGIEA